MTIVDSLLLSNQPNISPIMTGKQHLPPTNYTYSPKADAEEGGEISEPHDSLGVSY